MTLNELDVPVGRPIYLKLRSRDVVHSLYLPNFRTKIDAIPGMTTRLWFQATEAGRYEIACAQHCGVNHYKMRGLLDRPPGGRLPRLAGARRDRQPPPLRRGRPATRRLGLGDREMTADDEAADAEADDELPPAPTGFLRRFVFSIDHKVIGRQFLFLGLAFLAVGGLMAMLIRWQLARPGAPVPLVGKLLFGPSGGVISPGRPTPRSSRCTGRS